MPNLLKITVEILMHLAEKTGQTKLNREKKMDKNHTQLSEIPL